MLFDIRTIVGALLGLYGIVLVIAGLVHGTAGADTRTGGINANLWTGVALLVAALAFVVWARLRPVAVDHPAVENEDETDADR
ncbi:hypothetical protein [Nocardia sp. X0981]